MNYAWSFKKKGGGEILGVSLRNPARGKGHEEGGLTKCKGGIRPQGSPLDFLKHLSPEPKICLPFYIMPFTNSSDINRRLSPHHHFPEEVNLELLDNKSPGRSKSVSIQKPL